MPLPELLARLVAEDVTEVYDAVEQMCHLAVLQPELRAKLVEAKDTLFAARVLADEAAKRP